MNDTQSYIDAIRALRREHAHVIQRCDHDGYFIDLISDAEGLAQKQADDALYNGDIAPAPSDFEQHSVWNKAQTGVV